MNRIASVTLLKDATAKALYGSKGANGVVVIETKKPEAGKIEDQLYWEFEYSGDLILSSYNLCECCGESWNVRIPGQLIHFSFRRQSDGTTVVIGPEIQFLSGMNWRKE